MKEIMLTRGKSAIVDDDDFEHLNKYKWCVIIVGKNTKIFYAVRRSMGKYLYMHREIMGVTDSKKFIDHADRNGLNNQKSNLRYATHKQNMANRTSHGNTSKYLGVSKIRNMWEASCRCNGIRYRKLFKHELDAAKWYNDKAKELFGEFASLNEI